MAQRILIVDDEANVRTSFSSLLEDEGYQTEVAESVEAADRLLKVRVFDLMLLDLQLPGRSGLEFLADIRGEAAAPSVLIVSGQGDIPTALQAVRLGAVDFLEKPVPPERLIAAARSSLALHDAERQRRTLVEDLDSRSRIVGESAAIKRLLDTVSQVAPTDTSVLITGENGTGKELVATRLYLQSSRREQPYVRVNCPGIPETLFESQLFGHVKGAFTGAVKDYPGKFVQADGGTLFLDEIGDLPTSCQAKLLRVLETGEVETLGSEYRREVDVRVVCATNRDLHRLVADGTFREDLYYRISVFEIRLPSLAERPEDIPLLVGEFLRQFDPSGSTTLTPAAMAAVSARTFPGNVRQLRNLVERLTILSRGAVIVPEDLEDTQTPRRLPHAVETDGLSLAEQLERYERTIVEEVLRRCQGNISETARRLKVDRANLSRKIRDLGLK